MRAVAGDLHALVVRDASSVAPLLEALPSLRSRLEGEATRVFTQASGLGVFPPNARTTGSIYATDGARRVFRTVAVGDSITLHPGAWSRAMLAHLASLVAEDGELVVPFSADGGTAGRLSREELRRAFGVEPATVDGAYARFSRPVVQEDGPSVLSWFLADVPGIVQSLMLARHFRRATEALGLDDVLLEFLLDGAEPAVMSPRRWLADAGFAGGESWFANPGDDAGQAPIVYGAEYSKLLRLLGWHATEAGRRSAQLRRIVRELWGTSAISALDLGGTFGLVAVELALDAELAVRRAVCCDVSTTYLSVAMRVYRAYRQELFGRCFYSPCAPPDFAFEHDYSLITMFSSLGAVRPERRAGLLESCWDHLEPGGLLVVEQPPRFAPVGELTSADLGGMLGRFAPRADTATEHLHVLVKPG